jgi:hypothetical protein
MPAAAPKAETAAPVIAIEEQIPLSSVPMAAPPAVELAASEPPSMESIEMFDKRPQASAANPLADAESELAPRRVIAQRLLLHRKGERSVWIAVPWRVTATVLLVIRMPWADVRPTMTRREARRTESVVELHPVREKPVIVTECFPISHQTIGA